MPRPCSVCTDERRADIDRAIVAGQPYRRISTHFEKSESAIRRHAEGHVKAALAEAARDGQARHAADLLAEVESLKGRAVGILDAAEAKGRYRDAVAAIAEARQLVGLLARVAPADPPGTDEPTRVVYVGVKPRRVEAADPVEEFTDEDVSDAEPEAAAAHVEAAPEPEPNPERHLQAIREAERKAERKRRRQLLLSARGQR